MQQWKRATVDDRYLSGGQYGPKGTGSFNPYYSTYTYTVSFVPNVEWKFEQVGFECIFHELLRLTTCDGLECRQ